jgi:hypothetical protein
MVPLLRCSKPEDAARLLSTRYDKVLVRAWYMMPTIKLRIRAKELQDLPLYYGRAAQAFDREIDKWKDQGGVLIYYRSFGVREGLGPHDAQLLCECPLSIQQIDKVTTETEKLCVVRKPPTWRPHEEEVDLRFPTSTLCKRFWQASHDGIRNEALCKTIGIPDIGTHWHGDDELAERLGITPREFRVVRMTCLKNRDYLSIVHLIPRIEPEDATLLPAYEFIKNECPEFGQGVHLHVGNALKKVARFWRVAIRLLVRCGSVQRKTTTAIYLPSGLEPDWKEIDQDRKDAKSRLAEVMQMVDGLEEITADLLPAARKASSQRSSARVLP